MIFRATYHRYGPFGLEISDPFTGNYFLFDLMILTVMAYVLMINQDYAKDIAAIMIVLSIVYILNNSLKVYEICYICSMCLHHDEK